MRIGIKYFGETNQISVSSASGLSVDKGNAQPVTTVSPQSQVTFEARDGGVAFLGSETNAEPLISIISTDPSVPIEISTNSTRHRQYLGAVELRAEAGVIRIVNVVSLEDYLRGVVPAEMPGSYPIEALKAQAVCARSYALYSIGKHAAQGYNLCDSGHCQNYLGVPKTNSSGACAVAETTGQVLTWNGRVASTLYCTDCGGATQDCSEIRPGSNFPYLCTVQDPVEANHQCWEQQYRLDDLEGRLIKAGIKESEGLASISVSKIGSSGRALTVQITGKQATVSVSGDRLRTILGEQIKSTLFTIDQSDNGQVTFRGKGVGHGLGLCQIGAKALAQPPYNYTCAQILAHYYPGTVVSPTSAATTAIAPATNTITAQPVKRGKHRTQPNAESGNVDFNIRVQAPDKL